MKKLFIIIVLLSFGLILTGCPPEENKFYKQFDQYYMDTNILIDVYRIYQNDNDVIVLDIVDRNNVLNDFYIKANTLELLNVKVWGIEINEVEKNEEMYYWIDVDNVKDGNQFYLELIVGKDEVYKDAYYEDILKEEAIIHSFDCFFNDRATKEEYRFGREYYNDLNIDYHEEMIFLNGLKEVFTKTSFDSLYLPHNNGEIISFSKKMLYYPNDNYLNLYGSNDYFSAAITNDSNNNPNDNIIKYSYNDINYEISRIENYNEVFYEVHFNIHIDDIKSISYSYLIYEDNLDSIKAFLNTIDPVSLGDINFD